MIVAARERGDARSFAAVIRAAIGVPGWFSIQELSDRLDTPEAAIRDWCDPARAPHAVLRDFVFDELLAVLAETIGEDIAGLTAGEFAGANDLLQAATKQLTCLVRERLAHRGSVDQTGWLAQLTPIVAFIRPTALDDIAMRLGYADADVQRWASGLGPPRGADAEPFIHALAALFGVEVHSEACVGC